MGARYFRELAEVEEDPGEELRASPSRDRKFWGLASTSEV